MSILTRTITVEAPIEEVFDYALDPRKLWTMPDVALAEVDIKPEGVGTTARVWSHFLGFHLEGGMEYKEVVRPDRIVIGVTYFLEHPTWTFTFESVEGGTKVTGQGEWHVNVPAVGGTLETMIVKGHEPYLDTMLEALKGSVEKAPAV